MNELRRWNEFVTELEELFAVTAGIDGFCKQNIECEWITKKIEWNSLTIFLLLVVCPICRPAIWNKNRVTIESTTIGIIKSHQFTWRFWFVFCFLATDCLCGAKWHDNTFTRRKCSLAVIASSNPRNGCQACVLCLQNPEECPLVVFDSSNVGVHKSYLLFHLYIITAKLFATHSHELSYLSMWSTLL